MQPHHSEPGSSASQEDSGLPLTPPHNMFSNWYLHGVPKLFTR